MTDRYAESDIWPNPPASQQPARPATLAASEPSRVLGEGSDAQEARVAAYAEAIRRYRRGEPDDSGRRGVAIVMAVADAEQAELRRERDEWEREAKREREHCRWHMADKEIFRAEVERLRKSGRNWHRSAMANASDALRAERARDAALAEVTELRDRLGRVEALADEWEATGERLHGIPAAQTWLLTSTRLRAALAVTGDTEDASPAAEDAPYPRPAHERLAAAGADLVEVDTGAASPTEQATEGGGVATRWRDRHGDVWTFDAEGIGHSFETAPFPREHVERKWGPLVEVKDWKP